MIYIAAMHLVLMTAIYTFFLR